MIGDLMASLLDGKRLLLKSKDLPPRLSDGLIASALLKIGQELTAVLGKKKFAPPVQF